MRRVSTPWAPGSGREILRRTRERIEAPLDRRGRRQAVHVTVVLSPDEWESLERRASQHDRRPEQLAKAIVRAHLLTT